MYGDKRYALFTGNFNLKMPRNGFSFSKREIPLYFFGILQTDLTSSPKIAILV